MAYIEWSPGLSVGNDEIDGQHRSLFGMINELEAAREAGADRAAAAGVLESLSAYAGTHFALEERLFAERSYPGAEAHAMEHEDFKAKLRAFQAEYAEGRAGLDAELLSFLRSWLTRHISFSDRKYKPYLADRR